MTKVVIASVPFIDYSTPLAAPAYLKAVLEYNGIECVGLDLNIEIYNQIKNDPNKQLYLNFFYREEIDDRIAIKLRLMFYHVAKRILDHNPTHVGISVFSNESRVFTAWVCYLLRTLAPNVKIVIGGPGLGTLEIKNESFPNKLKSKGLIDDFIVGEDASTIVSYFKGDKSNANTVNWTQKPLDKITPNYDDYNFLNYENISLPIVDSRGCVQKCEFCNVIAFWKKFQYHDAETLFVQIKELIRKYNIYNFEFASSICNGNLVEFKKLVKMIADHNESSFVNEHIFWNGSFIIRKKNRHTEELWDLIKKSNGFLYCGVESMSAEARIMLGKNFNNEDLDDHIAMAQKYDVPMNMLVIASYHTENDEDYAYAKQWFEDRKHYANNPIMQIQLTMLGILEGTRLEQNIDLDEFNRYEEKRLNHARELKEKIIECGFTVKAFF